MADGDADRPKLGPQRPRLGPQTKVTASMRPGKNQARPGENASNPDDSGRSDRIRSTSSRDKYERDEYDEEDRAREEEDRAVEQMRKDMISQQLAAKREVKEAKEEGESSEEKKKEKVERVKPSIAEGEHKIEHIWTFWFDKKTKSVNIKTTSGYSSNLQEIGSFGDVSSFLGLVLSPVLMMVLRYSLLVIGSFLCPISVHCCSFHDSCVLFCGCCRPNISGAISTT